MKPEKSWGEPAFVDGNWAWQHEKEPILEAIAHCAMRIGTIKEDQDFATDYVVEIKNTRFAHRARRLSSIPNRIIKDITIRSKRASGAKTELAKLVEGKADVYVYTWVDDEIEEVLDFLVFDIKKAVSAGLLKATESSEIWNRDRQSAFIVVSISDLEEHGCIIARRRNGTAGSSADIQDKWKKHDDAKNCDCLRDKWIDNPDDKRHGWIRTECQCGRFIGYRLIRQTRQTASHEVSRM